MHPLQNGATSLFDRKYYIAIFSANPVLLKRFWSVQLMQHRHILIVFWDVLPVYVGCGHVG